jgi:predicted kinase
MKKPTLYLFIGYPGAGKTTVARWIAEATGAVHLWADQERHRLFAEPSHSRQESQELYEALNRRAEELLAAGQSVVFDTNFNFYADREKLRAIAARAGADCVILWIVVPTEVARERAIRSGETRNGYREGMTVVQFDAIVAKLEPPLITGVGSENLTENGRKDEIFIKIDGTKLDRADVLALISQYHETRSSVSEATA